MLIQNCTCFISGECNVVSAQVCNMDDWNLKQKRYFFVLTIKLKALLVLVHQVYVECCIRDVIIRPNFIDHEEDKYLVCGYIFIVSLINYICWLNPRYQTTVSYCLLVTTILSITMIKCLVKYGVALKIYLWIAAIGFLAFCLCGNFRK